MLAFDVSLLICFRSPSLHSTTEFLDYVRNKLEEKLKSAGIEAGKL